MLSHGGASRSPPPVPLQKIKPCITIHICIYIYIYKYTYNCAFCSSGRRVMAVHAIQVLLALAHASFALLPFPVTQHATRSAFNEIAVA